MNGYWCMVLLPLYKYTVESSMFELAESLYIYCLTFLSEWSIKWLVSVFRTQQNVSCALSEEKKMTRKKLRFW